MYKKRWILAICAGLLVYSSTILASGEDSFNKGRTAYKAGNYKKAAELFEKARGQGLTKVSVFFNLGSSYYRLAEYEKAARMFERVIQTGKMADVARFNLGLIARKQDKPGLAKKYFTQTISTSKNNKLVYLARKNLQEIDNQTGIWHSTILAEGGFNDNVSNTATGIAGGGDAFVTLAAYTHALIQGSKNKGWSVHGEFYNRSYSTITGYGLGSLSGGVTRNTQLFSRDAYLGAYYKLQTIDGGPFQNVTGVESGIRNRTDSGATYDYRYRYEAIDADAAYNYLQGTRQKLRLQRVSALGNHSTLILTYRLELNDRQNSATASYSNVRHGIRASYYHSTGNEVTWRATARYRISDYTTVATQNRLDNLVQFSIQRRKKLRHNLEWTLQYSLHRNDSTDSVYTYTSNIYQVGIRKRF